ncbi:MAG TPA: hypothetical protein VMH39_10245, partial [Gemmatimonadaceae bacterium]|nr:hypothetical protein [Gemmatimonadaceae bacterium]
NLGHLWLRAWGLRTGWRLGLRVAPALTHPVFRSGPIYIGRLAAFATGFGLPLAVGRIIGPGRIYTGEVLVAVLAGAALIVRLHGRVEGWRLALVALAFFVLLSVVA